MSMAKFAHCFVAAVLLAACGASAQSVETANKAPIAAFAGKPNIIFILADDFGVGEVSSYGADNYRTPNIDRLAGEGTRFTRAYTPSLCGPSRATILTGRYLFRTGGTNQDAVGTNISPQSEMMIPAVLKGAGYVSTMTGKWGQFGPGPATFGFDDYLTFKGSGAYWNTQKKAREYELNGRAVPLRDREYLPDVMHDHLIDFITANRSKPFYAFYSLSHVHTDILPTPDSRPDSQDLYADNVKYMDKLIGRLLADLERLKLRENTIIVFFGDNGTTNGRAPRATIGGRRLDGAKGSMLEGGSLEPLIISWPGHVPSGKVSHDLIDSSDFMPTFAALAGAKLPAGRAIDGVSFAYQLNGTTGVKRDWVYLQLANQWYVRDARWKLTQAGELYDMSDAPFSQRLVPMAGQDPQAASARQRLQSALEKLNPGGGFIDNGDGTGRHANKSAKRAARGGDRVGGKVSNEAEMAADQDD